MKLKPAGAIFALLITALSTYIMCVCGASVAGAVIGGACVLAASSMSLAVRAPQPRTSFLSATVSAVMLVVFICTGIALACLAAGVPTVVITDGVLLLVYGLAVYGIWQAKQ